MVRVVKRVRERTDLGAGINSASGRISDSQTSDFRDRRTFQRGGNSRAKAQARQREQEDFERMIASHEG